MTLKDALRSMELFATEVKANVGEPARR
jgi:hypothetical protein